MVVGGAVGGASWCSSWTFEMTLPKGFANEAMALDDEDDRKTPGRSGSKPDGDKEKQKGHGPSKRYFLDSGRMCFDQCLHHQFRCGFICNYTKKIEQECLTSLNSDFAMLYLFGNGRFNGENYD